MKQVAAQQRRHFTVFHSFEVVPNSHVRAGVIEHTPRFDGLVEASLGTVGHYRSTIFNRVPCLISGVRAYWLPRQPRAALASELDRQGVNAASEGSGDGTDVEKRRSIDWGDFEEAEKVQDRADNNRWRAEGSVDECVAHVPRSQSGLVLHIFIARSIG